ncbi:hypothetical protein JANAI62_05150 [Jannaschia pagri]|uniref:Uncharacterized protein n=1 Tax=Jannaschia pagri TaxID=2829797 RepID=A0ABQ4NHI4_9RHOB|nr:hypothetical protein JANAI61_04600 [Jannaschia sp. AI_61]GIT93892.1 hypothetical protein JANAI62_05150 [Jannaschia sp. AI_62]
MPGGVFQIGAVDEVTGGWGRIDMRHLKLSKVGPRPPNCLQGPRTCRGGLVVHTPQSKLCLYVMDSGGDGAMPTAGSGPRVRVGNFSTAVN